MKRLLLTVPLIVGLAYPASGEDPRDPLRIFYDKEEYADNLWGEVCWERVATLPENQEWKAQMQRYNDRLEQMTNLMNACASSASSVASDCVILVYITHEETMPLLDHFTAYLVVSFNHLLLTFQNLVKSPCVVVHMTDRIGLASV